MKQRNGQRSAGRRFRFALSLVLLCTIFAGLASPVSAAAQTRQRSDYTNYELKLLTAIVYCEAGNQSYEGKLAVANVVLNRVDSTVFDHVTNVKQAIYDLKRWGRQFAPVYKRTARGGWTLKGTAFEAALKLYQTNDYESEAQSQQMKESRKAAIAAMNGENNIGDKLYFNATVSATKARCKAQGKKYQVIGAHIFY